jgi:hypothetical protein
MKLCHLQENGWNWRSSCWERYLSDRQIYVFSHVWNLHLKIWHNCKKIIIAKGGLFGGNQWQRGDEGVKRGCVWSRYIIHMYENSIMKPTKNCQKGREDLRKSNYSRCRWLTPVILATQEAEIRRTAVRSQSGQIVPKTISKKSFTKKFWWSGLRCSPWIQALEPHTHKHTHTKTHTKVTGWIWSKYITCTCGNNNETSLFNQYAWIKMWKK